MLSWEISGYEAMDSLTLRQTTGKDSEFAYCVKRAAFKEYVAKVWGWNEEEQLQLHQQRFSAQDFRLINLAGTDIGIVAVVVAPDCLELNQLFLLPEHQGKGVGELKFAPGTDVLFHQMLE